MIGYLHVMSDKEIKQWHEDIDDWWKKLDYGIKQHIKMAFEEYERMLERKESI